MKSSGARLIVAASEASADLLYTTNFFVPDEMIWFEHKGKTHAVLSPLEIDRARATASVDIFIAADVVMNKLRQGDMRKKITTADVLVEVLTRKAIKQVAVPAAFPLHYARVLEKAKIQVQVIEPFFPEREIKSALEIAKITLAQRQAEVGLSRALEVLKAATITKTKGLKWSGVSLTSEILRGEIDAAVIKAGGLPAHTIVAGGKQGCDPHERGYGPLKAHQSIILDIFPRDQQTGYFGDLSRSVVKGKPSEALRKLHSTVAKGQQLVLDQMREGVDGLRLHDEVKDFFKKEGYPTEQRKSRWVGFFHGTGHSLGLEIHEAPRFGAGRFKAGQIMTVEPGLYYPEIGGVRIEDLVVIRKKGIKNLTLAPDVFEV
ncbi:MAG: Xaa-Pro peptidase family protein [Blastochloris sp.]|nr:Xaa-Pro peptidase family protein [Blastochloris sp.]